MFSEIVDKYADEIKSVPPMAHESPPDAPRADVIPMDNYEGPPLETEDISSHLNLYRFFGIEEGEVTDPKRRQQLQEIYKRAREAVGPDIDAIEDYLARLEYESGGVPMGRTRIDFLHQNIVVRGAGRSFRDRIGNDADQDSIGRQHGQNPSGVASEVDRGGSREGVTIQISI